MNLILLAPPAAGKGTLSYELKEKYGFNHISAGDVLREEVASGSELGEEIKEVISRGELVNNELLKKLIHKKLATLDKSKGFIFDGYPRTIDQIDHYKEICKDLSIEEGYGIYLELDKSIALERALGRITCPKCKRGYNKYSSEFKPKNENICDDCNIELVSRSDDNEESFSKRYNTYILETEPVIKVLENEKRLIIFDASRSSEEVLKDVIKFLEVNK